MKGLRRVTYATMILQHRRGADPKMLTHNYSIMASSEWPWSQNNRYDILGMFMGGAAFFFSGASGLCGAEPERAIFAERREQ
jgi:hypothetical protein